MIKIPSQDWNQPNTSDKLGSLFATKNVNLDERGYIKLSPRSVKIIDEATNADLGIAHAIGRYSQGEFQVATTSDANFLLDIDTQTLSATEESGTNEPTMTANSHAKFWIGRWHASTATAVLSKAANGSSSATWTSRITGLTSGVRHYMEVFASRNQFCVTNGNVVKQYDTSYASTVDLTVDADYEVVGIAYNAGRMGVITAIANSAADGVKEAKFYDWDGGTTTATGYGLETDRAIGIVPYRSSFAVLTRTGELKYFNGGGFETLAVFPFFVEDKWFSLSGTSGGEIGDLMSVDGDSILINIATVLNAFGRKGEVSEPHIPSGIWYYDPAVGLYHRYSPSISQVGLFTVTSGNVNTTTNVLTVSSGTVPATGNIARYIYTDTTEIGGLTKNHDYYIVKASATTFKLATTLENAINNITIDITSTGGSTNNFLMYTLDDYGATHYTASGAIGSFAETNAIYQDILFGGDVYTHAVANNDTLCMVVPYLENRGWVMTPKIFSNTAEDTYRVLTVKYRPLKTDDKIVVKGRVRNLVGLPVSAPNSNTSDEAVWVSKTEFYTSTDLSDVETHFNNGHEIEVEFTAGAGGGQTSKLTSITGENGVYSCAVEDEIIGAQSGRKSFFSMDNWTTLATITSSDEDATDVPLDKFSGKFVQFKIELRGSETTIEELLIDNTKHK